MVRGLLLPAALPLALAHEAAHEPFVRRREAITGQCPGKLAQKKATTLEDLSKLPEKTKKDAQAARLKRASQSATEGPFPINGRTSREIRSSRINLRRWCLEA